MLVNNKILVKILVKIAITQKRGATQNGRLFFFFEQKKVNTQNGRLLFFLKKKKSRPKTAGFFIMNIHNRKN